MSALVNLTQRLIRSDYRSFVHTPQRMIDLLRDRERLIIGLFWRSHDWMFERVAHQDVWLFG